MRYVSSVSSARKSLIVTIMQEVVDSLDVRVMLRVPEDVLKQRRHERHGYHTAGTRSLIAHRVLSLLSAVYPS